MRVCDLVKFSEEKYFNGAIQTEWFYEPARVKQIATSYVFHGPKYFGVSTNDITITKHQLIDSVSFAKIIADKLNAPIGSSSSNFVMTIAGYGTGKSHLAVCLGSLFGGTETLVKQVTENIRQADVDIGDYIEKINNKPNLVIVLNGMSNFNLDAEVLRCARLALKNNGIDDTILKSITKSYDIAKHFVEKNFEIYKNEFEKCAKPHSISFQGDTLKNYLVNNIETSNAAIEIINDVYTDVNGDAIHWDRGISAGDVLTLLQEKLCGETCPFNKILLLFDEFGRYIEYAASNPAIAGEAALQQIFESVQSANGKIVFTGFIQNDLSAYLSRIEKTANIIRYVGRYENSEKLYLSSNFETILANLLSKDEANGFSRVIDNATSRYEKFHTKIFDALSRWDRSAQKKSVWSSFSLYKSVILKGCYPLHPITTWLLSNTSSWMQQRSTIAFAAEMFNSVSTSDIDGTWLPYIYPIDVIDSSIYNEMLNSEEKGLVQSQFCMLYRDITMKVGNKLSDTEFKVLKAILIINIGRFSLRDKDDAIQAIRLCTNLKEEEIQPALKNMEDMYGVIAYDENAKTYDLIAEASGFNEFKRVYAKYRIGTVASIEDIDSDLMKEAILSGNVETSFAQEHNISSNEWVFERRLMAIDTIDHSYLESLKRTLNNNYTGEDPRGYLVYAYCNFDRDSEAERLSKEYVSLGISDYPIIILFLDDVEKEITDALTIKKTILKFSKADQERFQKHITGQIRVQNKKIVQKCIRLISQKQQITARGIVTYDERINALCSCKFNSIYTLTPPFAFDGFQNKTTAQAKKYLSNICIKLYDRTLMNIQSYQALTQDEKNRVKSCLSTDISTSWQVFDSNCCLQVPGNSLISNICSTIDSALHSDAPTNLFSIVEPLMRPPYGMNINAMALLTFYYIAYHGNKLFCLFGQEKLTASHLSDKIFKASKPQISELKRIRLQVNENAEIDQVADACKKALSCSHIEDCPALGKRLDDITKQEGVSAENQALVAQATVRLDEGIKLLKSIRDKNTKAKELVQDAKKTLVIHKFIKVFEYITDFSKPISDEYNFVCGNDIMNEVSHISDEVSNMLTSKYAAAISALTCDITQLSQVKGLYKKVAEALTQNGYNDFAKATTERIIKLEDELKAKQKYELMLAEMGRDITMYSDPSRFLYRKTVDALTKMNNWKTYLDEAKDLPNAISNPLAQKILTVICRLADRKEELLQGLVSVFDSISQTECLADLYEAEKELQKAIQQGFDSETAEKITSSASNLTKRINIVKGLPDSIDELLLLENDKKLEVDKVVSSEINRKRSLLLEKQKIWLQNYMLPETDLSKFTAIECVNWLESTEKLPSYLCHEVKLQYRSERCLVEKQLHTCKVEGVVSMYNKLNPDEKKQCLEMLLSK